MAATAPNRRAVVVSSLHKSGESVTYSSVTFAALEALSNRYANGLSLAGMKRGNRVLLMVKPGFDFVALVFALFKMGAVPVMIDPGMGVGRMLECIRQVDLHGFVGIPLAQLIRVLRPKPFAGVEQMVTVGRRWLWGGHALDRLKRDAGHHLEPADTASDEVAAILFTSGSTGPAKGVVYEHGMFDAQVSAIQGHYGIDPGEIDLPTFPLFALFSVAMGMTIVIPDMDPSHPAKVDPAGIVRVIQDQKVTNTFGSPAVWTRVAAYCQTQNVTLPSLRRILIAGAPVPYRVIESLRRALSEDADIHTPYGATESLPVSSISGSELLHDCAAKSRTGAGTCVGRPMDDIDLRIIQITDEPIENWSDELLVKDGQHGEIVVAGRVVTKAYFGLDDATALAKIHDGKRIWHRIGDIGYRDADGRIWFCGRKSHRVETETGTLFSVPCESVFNEHPDVTRSALVGVGPRGRQRPVIVVEPKPGRMPSPSSGRAFRRELQQLARGNSLTHRIEDVLFLESLPVDVRHNAKINRESLAGWAERNVQ